MLDKELFIESLKSQFKDDIQMIVTECQYIYKGYLDIDRLNLRLGELHKFAIAGGLTEDDWLNVLYAVCPEVLTQDQIAA